jgi:hypothetical protein
MFESGIPSMGGHEIGADLEFWASQAEPGTVIIELGAWLGAGTYHMAKEAPVPVHVFDRWKCRGREPEKAFIEGVEIRQGQDLLPIIKSNLRQFGNVVYHKGEIINRPKWRGPHISLYVDDACKRSPTFEYALDIFSAWWIPGKTVIVLMDYHWHERHKDEPDAQVQKQWYNNNRKRLEILKDWPELCPRAFRWLG